MAVVQCIGWGRKAFCQNLVDTDKRPSQLCQRCEMIVELEMEK